MMTYPKHYAYTLAYIHVTGHIPSGTHLTTRSMLHDDTGFEIRNGGYYHLLPHAAEAVAKHRLVRADAMLRERGFKVHRYQDWTRRSIEYRSAEGGVAYIWAGRKHITVGIMTDGIWTNMERVEVA